MPPVFHLLLVAADPVLLDGLDEWLRTSAQAPCTRVRCDHAAAAASLLGREEFDLVLFALDPAETAGADALARLAAAAPATPVPSRRARRARARTPGVRTTRLFCSRMSRVGLLERGGAYTDPTHLGPRNVTSAGPGRRALAMTSRTG